MSRICLLIDPIIHRGSLQAVVAMMEMKMKRFALMMCSLFMIGMLSFPTQSSAGTILTGKSCKEHRDSCKKYCLANRTRPDACLTYCGQEYPRCLQTGIFSTDLGTATNLVKK